MNIFLIINYTAHQATYESNLVSIKQENITNKNSKEQFLSNLFYYLKETNYSLIEKIDFGYENTNEISLLIEKEQFSDIKSFIKNNFLVKNLVCNTASNNGTLMIEFSDSSFIQLDFVWNLNSNLDIKEVLNSTKMIDGLKILNNYYSAKYIGLMFYEINMSIPKQYKKFGVALMNSKLEIDKLICNLYFNKNINETIFLLNTKY